MNRPALIFALVAISSSALAIDPVVYRYRHDISTFALSSGGADRTLYLDLQLTDGLMLGNGSTSMRLFNFSLVGGTFGTPLVDLGGVTRNGDGSITLRDNNAGSFGLADYTVPFNVTAGVSSASLQFDIETLPTSFDTASPDYFNVSYLLSDFTTVNTTGLIGKEQLGLTFDGNPGTAPLTYGVDADYASGRAALQDLRFRNLSTPQVIVLQTPEPASFAVLGLGAAALIRRRRKG